MKPSEYEQVAQALKELLIAKEKVSREHRELKRKTAKYTDSQEWIKSTEVRLAHAKINLADAWKKANTVALGVGLIPAGRIYK
jgi:uncharacterized protein (DUF1684 family)